MSLDRFEQSLLAELRQLYGSNLAPQSGAEHPPAEGGPSASPGVAWPLQRPRGDQRRHRRLLPRRGVRHRVTTRR